MELDPNILLECRTKSLPDILSRSYLVPDLPLYIEKCVAEGRYPSEQLVSVRNLPRFRFFVYRGLLRFWNSLRVEEYDDRIGVDMGIGSPKNNLEILCSCRTSFIHKSKLVVMSKRAYHVILDLFWIEKRDGTIRNPLGFDHLDYWTRDLDSSDARSSRRDEADCH